MRDNAQTVQNVVTYDAVVDVENPERLLKPGMTASVVFVYAEKADALRVPLTIVFVTHEPDVARYASRLLVMRDARIVSDTPQEPNQAAVDSARRVA